MAEKQNPVTLAGATGVKMPDHAIAAGHFSIAHWKPLGKIVATLACQVVQRLGEADD